MSEREVDGQELFEVVEGLLEQAEKIVGYQKDSGKQSADAYFAQ